jgi:hypothetical protein
LIEAMKIPGSKSVSTGILVHAGEKRAVFLVDAVEGEEHLAPGSALATALRGDGSPVKLMDVPAFLTKPAKNARPTSAAVRKKPPAKKPGKKSGKKPGKKKKPKPPGKARARKR